MARAVGDPLRSFKFRVRFYSTGGSFANWDFGFISVEGLRYRIESTPYYEGGNNYAPRMFPTQATPDPITLSRGTHIGSNESWDWFKATMSNMSGGGLGVQDHDFVQWGGTLLNSTTYRCDVVIDVLGHPITYMPGRDFDNFPVKLRFKALNAYISQIGWSNLDAGTQGFGAVLVQQIQFVHEGLQVQFAAGDTHLPAGTDMLQSLIQGDH